MDVADVGPDRDQLAAEQACLESLKFPATQCYMALSP